MKFEINLDLEDLKVILKGLFKIVYAVSAPKKDRQRARSLADQFLCMQTDLETSKDGELYGKEERNKDS